MKNFIKNTALLLTGAIAGAGGSVMMNYQNIFKEKDDKLIQQQRRAGRNAAIIDVMAQWLQLKQEGRSLADYFEKKGYNRIAIYGMHYLGEALYRELKNTNIEVRYAIDKNAGKIVCEIPCIDMNGTLERVDAIVVTPVFHYFEIEDELSGKVDYPIISIEDVIFDML